MLTCRQGAASAAVCFALVLAACGGEKKVRAPSTPAATSETNLTSAPATRLVSPTIAVSDEIARACELRFNDLAMAPKFDFDKSDLSPADHDVLAKIGQCVTSGPLKGRTIKLIGRADPRGTIEYNMALGARRASSVASFLDQLGADRARIRETSRGELDATGTDETTWLIDRRVDIVLAE